MGKNELAVYLQPLRKWWWLMVLTTAIAGVSCLLYLLSQPDLYRAQTTIMIGTGVQELNPDNSQFGLAEQLALVYADIADRAPLRQATMEALNLERLPTYEVNVVTNSPLIEIAVTDTDPARAQAVARELVNQLILQSPAGQAEHERQQFVVEQLAKLELGIEETEAEIERAQAELTTMFSAREIADTQGAIVALQNKLTSLRANYSSLLENSQQGAINRITILEPAAMPFRPVDQQRVLNMLLALMVGFTLGAGGAYLLEFLNDSIQRSGDVPKQTGLPLLASIPAFEHVNRLVMLETTSPAVMEAYRALRTNIQHVALNRALRVLMMTGPTPNDGKSITTANLCIVLANAGKRVILVDADLHRPRQHQLFQVSNTTGLATLLQEEELEVTHALRTTSVANLQLLPSGPLPRNAAELLGSGRMGQLLDGLKAEADIIILDTPPVGAVVDATVLATQVDGVVMVLRANSTEWPVAKHALEVLQQVDAPLVGTVLNAVPLSESIYHHAAYGYGLGATTEKGPERATENPAEKAAMQAQTSEQQAVRGRPGFSLLRKRANGHPYIPTNGHSKSTGKDHAHRT